MQGYLCDVIIKKAAHMDTISINDIIYATATVNGSTTANLRLSGLSSASDVVRAIRREIGSFTGMITITTRNMTQGWSRRKSLYLAPRYPKPTPSPGTQLTLF